MKLHCFVKPVLTGALLLAASAAASKDLTNPDIGRPPAWDKFKEVAEAEVRSKLVDPTSAEFEWPHGYTAGYLKPLLSKRIRGYWTCGLVNSKNRMGGFAGRAYFVVIIAHDAAIYTELGQQGRYDPTAARCAAALSKGILPPASEMLTNTGWEHAENEEGAIGMEVRFGPVGVLVATVVEGGAAAEAGVRPGMIITHLNGIKLVGFSSQQKAEMFREVKGEIRLTVDGKGQMLVRRKPLAKNQSF